MPREGIMIGSHRSFGLALLTVGEFGWLAAFGALLMLKDQEGQLHAAREQLGNKGEAIEQAAGKSIPELEEGWKQASRQLQAAKDEALWLRGRMATNQN